MVFSELKHFKTPKKLLQLLKENKKQTKKLLFSLTDYEGEIKSFCVLKDLVEKIFSLYLEIERIILSNN